MPYALVGVVVLWDHKGSGARKYGTAVPSRVVAVPLTSTDEYDPPVDVMPKGVVCVNLNDFEEDEEQKNNNNNNNGGAGASTSNGTYGSANISNDPFKLQAATKTTTATTTLGRERPLSAAANGKQQQQEDKKNPVVASIRLAINGHITNYVESIVQHVKPRVFFTVKYESAVLPWNGITRHDCICPWCHCNYHRLRSLLGHLQLDHTDLKFSLEGMRTGMDRLTKGEAPFTVHIDVTPGDMVAPAAGGRGGAGVGSNNNNGRISAPLAMQNGWTAVGVGNGMMNGGSRMNGHLMHHPNGLQQNQHPLEQHPLSNGIANGGGRTTTPFGSVAAHHQQQQQHPAQRQQQQQHPYPHSHDEEFYSKGRSYHQLFQLARRAQGSDNDDDDDGDDKDVEMRDADGGTGRMMRMMNGGGVSESDTLSTIHENSNVWNFPAMIRGHLWNFCRHCGRRHDRSHAQNGGGVGGGGGRAVGQTTAVSSDHFCSEWCENMYHEEERRQMFVNGHNNNNNNNNVGARGKKGGRGSGGLVNTNGNGNNNLSSTVTSASSSTCAAAAFSFGARADGAGATTTGGVAPPSAGSSGDGDLDTDENISVHVPNGKPNNNRDGSSSARGGAARRRPASSYLSSGCTSGCCAPGGGGGGGGLSSGPGGPSSSSSCDAARLHHEQEQQHQEELEQQRALAAEKKFEDSFGRLRLYHIVSMAEITPAHYDEDDPDSEEEVDQSWRLDLNMERVRSLEDCSAKEKVLWLLWNKFAHDNYPIPSVYGERYTRYTVELFTILHRAELNHLKLRVQLLGFLKALHIHGLIDSPAVKSVMECLDGKKKRRDIAISARPEQPVEKGATAGATGAAGGGAGAGGAGCGGNNGHGGGDNGAANGGGPGSAVAAAAMHGELAGMGGHNGNDGHVGTSKRGRRKHLV